MVDNVFTGNFENVPAANREYAVQNNHYIPNFYALIPAGGVGSRLWPLSQPDRPKFLYDLTASGKTMLQSTFARLSMVTPQENILVSTGSRHVPAVCAQLPELRPANIVAEPSGRDSMAAIALATAILARRHGDRIIVGSFAADHVVADPAEFARVLAQAAALAEAGYIATIGIRPTNPSTAFGYIHQGQALGSVAGAPDAFAVQEFVEKPDATRAQKYCRTGEYAWNAGMFIMQAKTLLDDLHRLLPRMYDQVSAIARMWDGPQDQKEEALTRIWPQVEKIAFDYAIAEPISRESGVAMVPGDFGWNDIGDFASLSAYVPPVDGDDNRLLAMSDSGCRPRIISLGSTHNLIVVQEDSSLRGSCSSAAGKPDKGETDKEKNGQEKTIALIGMEDMVVVETPEALLIMPKSAAQDVKKISEILKNPPKK